MCLFKSAQLLGILVFQHFPSGQPLKGYSLRTRFKPSEPGYFHWLDGLRGVAALVIVVFHYHHFYLPDAQARPSIPPIDSFPWSGLLAALYQHGHLAVELFWILSGFVFTHVYLQRRTTLRDFSAARIIRLYPLHLLMLLLVAAIQITSLRMTGHWQIYGNNDWKNFLLQLGLASHWSTLSHGLSFNGPIWSVSLEVVVYFIFFAVVGLLRRFGLLAGGLFALGFFWLGQHGSFSVPYLSSSVFVCAGYFFVGSTVRMALSHMSFHAFPVGLAGVICLGVFVTDPSPTLRVISASTALILGLAWIEHRMPNPPRPVMLLGDLSYAIYLVHVPIQMIVLLVADIFLSGTRVFAEYYVTLPLHLILTLLFAWIVHRKFEVPVGRRLKRLLLRPNGIRALSASEAPKTRSGSAGP